jgi:hypothetical protein
VETALKARDKNPAWEKNSRKTLVSIISLFSIFCVKF